MSYIKKDKQINLRLETETIATIKKLAKKMRLTISDYIRKAIMYYIEMEPCKRSNLLANDCECDHCIDRAEADADLLRGN